MAGWRVGCHVSEMSCRGAEICLFLEVKGQDGGKTKRRIENRQARPLVPLCVTGNRCRATRGLLATDHVILNHGQVTWTTPELAPPSPNYHTTPTGGRFSSRQI
ncbi:hypothetical protein TNCV_831161 [Trichonephila clavipes]|nr:hypothetical protein TNCV_831161 [Trichonephila clavipes]